MKNKKFKILSVDDTSTNNLLIGALLTEENMTVDFAKNGYEAINKLQKKKYDAILMDIYMPILNGYETTLYIRNKLKLKTPIIAISGIENKYEIGIKYVGFNELVSKPINSKMLIDKIKGLLIPKFEMAV